MREMVKDEKGLDHESIVQSQDDFHSDFHVVSKNTVNN